MIEINEKEFFFLDVLIIKENINIFIDLFYKKIDSY